MLKRAMLTCEVELMTISGGGRGTEIGLVFHVHNPGKQPAMVNYFKPFIRFDLSVWVGEEPMRVSQPAYDVPAQPQSITIAPGESVRIDTPIRLRFAGGGHSLHSHQPTVWTLEHPPAPILLRVQLHLEGAGVTPCETRYDPVHASASNSLEI
jgi:hypothetical protein